MLFTLGWKEQRRYDTAMFLLEMFVQNLVLGFFGPRKIKCKTRKKTLKRFIIDIGFISCLTSIRLTHTIVPNCTVVFLQSYVNFSNFK